VLPCVDAGGSRSTSAITSLAASFSSAAVTALASRRLARKHISGVVGTRRRRPRLTDACGFGVTSSTRPRPSHSRPGLRDRGPVGESRRVAPPVLALRSQCTLTPLCSITSLSSSPDTTNPGSSDIHVLFLPRLAIRVPSNTTKHSVR
jgi:hypothetical protein